MLAVPPQSIRGKPARLQRRADSGSRSNMLDKLKALGMTDDELRQYQNALGPANQ